MEDQHCGIPFKETREQVMLATSAKPPRQHFDGYFFHGVDYVFGESGLRALEDAKSFTMKPGLDGCYVFAEKVDGGYQFGTDFSGYRTLYYYHDGSFWAVSDSFSRIVDALKEAEVRVHPDYPQLGSIYGTASTNNQLFSWNTPMKGVKLLPRGAVLTMTSTRPIIDMLPLSKSPGYEDGLKHHIELWTSRFATILAEPKLEMSIDLTGGVDSRTNFALAKAASSFLGAESALPRFTCGGELSESSDLTIATELCNFYGFEINKPNRVPPYLLGAPEGYQLWRDYSLGVYNPLVVPGAGRKSTRVHMSGGGGEVHRDYYSGATLEAFAKGHARRNRYHWLGDEAGRAGIDAALAVAEFRSESPLRSNYREFRHRYHVGRTPRNGVSFTPLDSWSAEAANLAVENVRPDGALFNFDILASLDWSLVEMRFDSPNKSPSAEIREQLVIAPLNKDFAPGGVWGLLDPDDEQGGGTLSRGARIAPFVGALDEAANDAFVRSFCGDDTIMEAQRLVATISGGGSIGNPVNGHPVSAVLAAHLVSPDRAV